MRAAHPVRWGNLRRLDPIDDTDGAGRGTPIHRYYEAAFVDAHSANVRGRVLEYAQAAHSRRLGHDLATVDVLDIDPHNPAATVLADLGDHGSLPAGEYDCVVVGDALRYVPDLDAAIANLWQSLDEGGVLLLVSPVVAACRDDGPRLDRWRLLPAVLEEALMRADGRADLEVVTFGNRLSASAALAGLAAEDLRVEELAAHDSRFPVVVAARAAKPGAP